MYLNYYGFKDKPFEVTPDPKFLFMTNGYQEILSALVYGIHERRGFIAVVGEVGTGKTLMLNALLDRLDRKHKAAFIFNSDLTFKQLLTMVLCDLGVATPEERISKVEAIQRLNEFAIKQLERDGNVIIIIDEAQNISDKTMENIRMLSNLETRKHKLVQIVLCGQPELDEKLSRHEWRQLVQRISLKRYAMTLTEEDTYRYLQHRITVAQYEGSSLFTREAQNLIWEFSGGIPRKINILCDNALLIGYGLGRKEIDSEIIKEAINDLSWSPFIHAPAPQNSPPAVDETEQPAPGQNDIFQEARPSDEGAAEMDSIPQGIRFTDGEETTSLPAEIPSFETMEALKGVPKPRLDRRQSSLIAGVLILVCLIIIVWFFFTKSKVNVGENISLRSQNEVQTEAIDRLKRSPCQFPVQAQAFSSICKEGDLLHAFVITVT
jgi:type II secretory pathway predicted ATPase ExeA